MMGGKASRRKGQAFEQAVRRWAVEWAGVDLVSNPASSGYSGADMRVDGLPIDWEIKNQAKMTLAAWVDQATEQADPAGAAPFGAVIHKRAGRGDVGDAYVTMRADDFVGMIQMVTASVVDANA